ncbi:MAG TPA: tetratricopeptide repeat protein, partial [Campylobacterales bacterium]|nr:tetratricopeptide repeat protein [Campylobacterales bacterium]
MKEEIKLFIWDNLSEAVDIFPPSVGAKLTSLKAKNKKANFFEQLVLITELNETIVSTIENRYLIFISESDNKLSYFVKLLDKEALRDVPYRQRKEYVEAAEKIAAKEADSQELATLLNSIGRIYIDLAEYDKALERHEKALKICLATVGENHSDAASSYNGIGSVCYSKGEHDKALAYYEKALKIRLAVVGENHPDTASSYSNIGAAYHSKGGYDKALAYYEKALKIRLAVV